MTLQRRAVLQQGIDLPSPHPTANEPLPEALSLLTEPPKEAPVLHEYALKPNTAGHAKRKRFHINQDDPLLHKQQAYSAADGTGSVPSHTEVEIPSTSPPLPVSRTTAYRRERMARLGIEAVYNKHKSANCCSHCGIPRTADTGHSQYRGRIFCPSRDGDKDLWLSAMRAAKKKN